MYRPTTAIALIAAVAVAAVFGTSAASAARPGALAEPAFTDDEIRAAAYGPDRVHPGAYFEDLAGEDLYYVNTVSIGASSTWIELCSDDEAQAAAWAAETNARSSQQRALLTQDGNAKYFEFRYGDAYGVIRLRVHRCSYAAPSADLLGGGTGEWGTFNGSLAKNGGREFAQYNWFRGNYGPYAGKLMATVGGSNKFGEVYDLYHAYVAETGGPGMCDEIALAKTTVLIDKARGVHITGEIVRTVAGDCHPGWS